MRVVVAVSSASRQDDLYSYPCLNADDLPSPRRYSFAQSSNPSDHSSCGTSPSVKTFSMNNNDCVGSVKEYFVEKTCYLHIIRSRISLACCGKIEPDEREGEGLALTIICLILGLTILTSVFRLLSGSVDGLTAV
jgi:cAMP phosphodiesterase